jgi:hypothetical protein
MTIIYNTDTGLIRISASYSEEEVAMNLTENESSLDGFADPDLFQVVDGAVVPLGNTIPFQIELRVARDAELSACDWTQVPDSPLTAEQRSEWQMYRQRLRDLPSDYSHVTSLEDVVWPDPPS